MPASPSTAPARRLLAVLGRALLGLGVAVVLLGAVEGGMRLAWGPPPPAVRVLSLIDAEAGWFQEQDGRVRALYQRNEAPPPFPARLDGPRAIVLGGSSVHLGTPGLDWRGEFPALIEEHTGIPTLNLGQVGADSHDCASILEAMGPWDVSIVVAYVAHNDVGNLYFRNRYATPAAGLAARIGSSLERFQIYARIRRAIRPPDGQAWTRRRRPDAEIVAPERLATALGALETNLRRIVHLARARDAVPVLVTPVGDLSRPPVFARCLPEACPRDLHARGIALRGRDPAAATALLEQAWDQDHPLIHDPSSVPALVRRVAADTGAILVDARRDLPREEGLDVPAHRLFADSIHFSPEGHRAMADLIAPVVAGAASEGRIRP